MKPFGIYNINGVPHGFIQLDYFTLWNRDDGLIAGGYCYELAPVIGLSLDAFGGHQFDKERSATLVAAPLVNGNYDTSFTNYKAYGYFTAAHEDVSLSDQSSLFYPLNPINFGGHIELAFSRSKHSTYPFNPDYLPILDPFLIFSIYVGIDSYYAATEDYETYLIMLYIADTVIYTCIVEHFQEQGGTFAGTRINVGEPAHPINNSGFIQDSELTQKLNKLIFIF